MTISDDVAAVDAFYLEHRLCPGGLDGGVERAPDGDVVWMACPACGARLERRVSASV